MDLNNKNILYGNKIYCFKPIKKREYTSDVSGYTI